MTALAAMTACWADEKTDVTAQYVTNASFEADAIASLEAVNNSADGLRGYKVSAPQGWSVTNTTDVVSLIVTADCYTDNNFGKVTTLADGQQAYYLRMGWSTGATIVSQTISSLPKGKYQLQVGVRSAYANNAMSMLTVYVGSKMAVSAFNQGSTGCFTSTAWSNATLDFEQEADGSARIAFQVDWQSGGSCIMYDNVRLYRLPDDYVTPDNPTPDSPTEGTVLSDFVAETTIFLEDGIEGDRNVNPLGIGRQ